MLLTILQSAFAKPARMLLAASLSIGLVACGGGGGSPGSIPGSGTGTDLPTVKPVASISLVTSADTISGSGVAGTEVTLTAVAKDAGNNAMPGVTISFAASSGAVSNTNRITDANGAVVEKLSTSGDPTPRAITITASSGGATSAAKTVTVVAAGSITSKLLLTASSGTLPSAGTANSGVEIRALVLTANNVVLPNTVVSFTADSGSLTAAQKTTDAAGVAVVKLDTAADPTNRVITVTASINGTPASVVKVSVVGTKLTVNAPTSVNLGSKVDLTASLTDSAGNPLAGHPITFTSTSGALTTNAGGGSPAMTDSAGKLVLNYTGTANGTAIVSLKGLGETATASITTVSTTFTVSVVDGVPGAYVPRTTASTDTCNAVLVHDFDGTTPREGSVNVSTSRGTIYSNATCTTPLTGAVMLAAGEATVYLKATSPGLATLTANSNTSGTSVQSTVDVTAPLTSNATISVQATPAVIGANTPGSTSQQSTIRAIVLDRITSGNPVKNARVAFSIVNDPSGGVLSQPSEVLTASDGSASVSYIAGLTSTGANAVVIRAQIISAESSAASTAALTVSQRSLFITAGTGNTVEKPTSVTYKLDYAVFVTDAAGNPVSGVTVTASARPRTFSKGTYEFNGTFWAPKVTVTCQNEDRDSNGVLGTGEDLNNNGRLDPGISLNITSGATTAADGTATISITYPRDRTTWIDVDFIIRGAVSGSESSYVGYVRLPGAGEDFSSEGASPPGNPSPYGVSASCSDTL